MSSLVVRSGGCSLMIELAEQWLIDGAPLDRQIAAVFDRCFAGDYRTQLCGGAEEPLYVPAGSLGELHTVWYREDFARSALHEAAHWCIAGDARRQLDDYGYWYEPDGRNEVQQREFERVESRPQALEWFFAMAAGLPFRVSIDNLSGGDIDDFPFALAVWQRAHRYASEGLPPRAERFRRALAVAFCQPLAIDSSRLLLTDLRS